MSQREIILNEIKDIPEDRLDELQQFIQTLLHDLPVSDERRKAIQSFSGAFKDMNDEDFTDFVAETKRIRKGIFDRNVEI